MIWSSCILLSIDLIFSQFLFIFPFLRSFHMLLFYMTFSVLIPSLVVAIPPLSWLHSNIFTLPKPYFCFYFPPFAFPLSVDSNFILRLIFCLLVLWLSPQHYGGHITNTYPAKALTIFFRPPALTISLFFPSLTTLHFFTSQLLSSSNLVVANPSLSQLFIESQIYSPSQKFYFQPFLSSEPENNP